MESLEILKFYLEQNKKGKLEGSTNSLLMENVLNTAIQLYKQLNQINKTYKHKRWGK